MRRVVASSIQQLGLCAGALSFVLPSILHAVPVMSETAKPTQIAAQSGSRSTQAYQSRQLGFRFEYPETYTLDTSKEQQGVLTLRSNAIPPAIGSDQPDPNAVPGSDQPPFVTGEEPQRSPGDKISIRTFNNPQRLSAIEWAKRNEAQSYFSGLQSNPRQYQFAGKPAVSYSWCSTAITNGSNCGDSVILPSRDGRQIIVLSAVYDYPGDEVRWDFQNMVGKLRLTR